MADTKIVVPKAGDHVAWAVYYGEQCIRTIERCQARTLTDPLDLDNYTVMVTLDLEHIKRTARFAWYHVCRAKGYKYWDVLHSGVPK